MPLDLEVKMETLTGKKREASPEIRTGFLRRKELVESLIDNKRGFTMVLENNSIGH